MNCLINDHSRFLTRTNRQVGRTGTHGPEKANEGINKGIMKEAVVIQMTWPGAPTIYYGDEVGVCGWTDLIIEEPIHGEGKIWSYLTLTKSLFVSIKRIRP